MSRVARRKLFSMGVCMMLAQGCADGWVSPEELSPNALNERAAPFAVEHLEVELPRFALPRGGDAETFSERVLHLDPAAVHGFAVGDLAHHDERADALSSRAAWLPPGFAGHLLEGRGATVRLVVGRDGHVVLALRDEGGDHEPLELVRADAPVRLLGVTPAGEHMLYVVERVRPELWALTLDAQAEHRMLGVGPRDDAWALSDDGDWIAFERADGEGAQLRSLYSDAERLIPGGRILPIAAARAPGAPSTGFWRGLFVDTQGVLVSIQAACQLLAEAPAWCDAPEDAR